MSARSCKLLAYNAFTERRGHRDEKIRVRRCFRYLDSGMERAVGSIKTSQSDGGIHGASLKWIHAAEPEFQRKKLDLDKYIVSVVEQEDSVMVGLRSFDSVEGTRGSSESHPGYEVEIRK